jgi:ADP-ribose pyrophosphatase YjhB (NUDIX family)
MIHKIAGSLWKKIPRWSRRFVTRVCQTKFTASAGVVIVNSSGEILLLDHQIRPGSGWGIPGGFIDYGEQPTESALREVLEETGIRLEDIELVDFITRGGHLEFLFRARSDGVPTVDGKEILGFGWFKPEHFPEEMTDVQRERVIVAVKDWFDN